MSSGGRISMRNTINVRAAIVSLIGGPIMHWEAGIGPGVWTFRHSSYQCLGAAI